MNAIPSFSQYSLQVKNQKAENKIELPATNPIQKQTKIIDKKKLAVGVAAGAGIAALVVGGILYKKKIDAAKIKQLAEHIDFKNAQTLEEAIEFGKNNLGIKKYQGFKDGDLDVLNWINQGLTRNNNVTKGKALMPKEIVYVETLTSAQQSALEAITPAAINGEGTMLFAKDAVDNTKDFVTKIINSTADSAEKKKEFLEKLQKGNNFANWRNTKIDILKLGQNPKVTKAMAQFSNVSTFAEISHELGHWQHFNNPKFRDFCLGSAAIEKGLKIDFEIPDEVQKLRDLFEKNKDLAKCVSDYASASPLEFVAECYSKMIDGQKLPEPIMKLYQALGGVCFE